MLHDFYSHTAGIFVMVTVSVYRDAYVALDKSTDILLTDFRELWLLFRLLIFKMHTYTKNICNSLHILLSTNYFQHCFWAKILLENKNRSIQPKLFGIYLPVPIRDRSKVWW